MDALRAKFHFDDLAAMRIEDDLRRFSRDLMEEKSSRAQVLSFDGTTLRLRVPAATLDEDALDARLARLLAASLGTELAATVLADADARQLLIDRMNVVFAVSGGTYTFVRLRAESDPSNEGPEGYARFRVEGQCELSRDFPTNIRNSTLLMHENMIYSEIYRVALGWNALAKAPVGYFRREPIAGAESRPPPLIVVIEDLDKKEAEVWNVRYPGSRDIVR